jgi:hypothetical protein
VGCDVRRASHDTQNRNPEDHVGRISSLLLPNIQCSGLIVWVFIRHFDAVFFSMFESAWRVPHEQQINNCVIYYQFLCMIAISIDFHSVKSNHFISSFAASSCL